MGFCANEMVENNQISAPFDQLLKLTEDREIFQKISQAKKEFVAILSVVGNGIAYATLDGIHKNHKGIKISQGNELENCPYQVLDVFRDFDINHGLNIRVLHWWGRGAYILVYLGANHPILQAPGDLVHWIKVNSYELTNTKLFGYKQIIDEGQIISGEKLELKQLINHLSGGKPFQIFKEIPVKDKVSLVNHLGKEIEKILNWMS
ncbi:hypothetical protein [uncultured Cyclobacterium sp.]|uniref:hypothetical protein n=1 Tax=uncultured Cyclobacterium sp. TaxID=453820 RepID=UPI0030ECD54A